MVAGAIANLIRAGSHLVNKAMPTESDTEYPPQFASSDLAALLGQINDFAGVEPPPPPPPTEMKAMSAKGKTAAKSPSTSSALIGDGPTPVPVTIVGSSAMKGPFIPGLRDVLVGVSILRLLDQLSPTASADAKNRSKAAALELITGGSARLTEFSKKSSAALKK